MSAANVLLKPEECTMLLVDFQAWLGFLAFESVVTIRHQGVGMAQKPAESNRSFHGDKG
jgi:hypothetical protein